jgi:hypothetical protein
VSISYSNFPQPVRVAFFLGLKVVHSVTHGDYAARSLGHRRRRNDGLTARIRSIFLRRQLLELPDHQQQTLSAFFQHLGNQYRGMYKCVRFSDLK